MSTEIREPRAKSPYKLAITDDDDTNKLIRDLIKKRGIVRGRLTRFSNYLNTLKTLEILPVQTMVDLKLRIQGAASLFSEYNNLQTQLEESVLEIDLDEQLNQRELFEESYYGTLARAECMLGSGEVNSVSKSMPDTNSVKLPTISIPTFDGSYERWLEFRDTFQSLIHNSQHISGIQKFHYLKSSLKGSAALVIDSLEFSAANYAVAWELLLTRYDNSRLLVHNHVKSLFTIQALTKEAPDQLRHLTDTVLKNLRALKLLGEPVDSWDTLIIYILVSKLDKTTEREWEQYKNTTLKQSGDSKSILKVNVLLTFLKDRADMLETLQVSHASSNSNKKQLIQTSSNHKIHCNVTTNNPHGQVKRVCLLCKKYNHPLYACQKFLSCNLEARLKLIKENSLCENCLRAGHNVEDCRFGPCRKCEQRHNSLIHKDSPVSRDAPAHTVGDNNKPAMAMHSSLSAPPPPPPAKPSNDDHATGTHTKILCANYPCVQPVLLSTALVEVKDRYNNYQQARALLDSGSERCIITRSLCDKLGAQTIQSTHEIRGVGNSASQSTQICEVDVKSRTSPYTMRIQCFVLPNITSTLPEIPKEYAMFGIPDNIKLADPKFYESHEIDILIGADKFWDLLGQGKMRLPKGPYLQNTRLGWIVSGPINHNMHNKGHIQCNFSQAVDEQLRKFWELEELPSLCDTRSEEEKECEAHFIKTTMRNNDGRFCVSIPFKSSPHNLGETYPQALNRFLALEKRLQRDPEYKRLYIDFIHEYVALGHMTRVDSYGIPNFFMPHHGVLREHSTTTKLRVVFNASAASSTGVSLNELQLVGPPIQGDLLGILLRLRLHKYAACSDIEKMYRQSEICESQRDLQLILWRDDPTHEIGIFRHNRIVYGTASAAFMACRCLKQLAADCTDPDVKRVINEDFFVDDMITTLDDKDQLLDLCKKTYKVLHSGCFPLRKWVFNFDYDDQEAVDMFDGVKPLNLDKSSLCKTLGIGWNNSSDELQYNTQFKNSKAIITKREILSHVSQIFDPYGLLSPTIMIAKVLLQRLWLLKLDWDDALPSDVTEVWNRFANSLSALGSIRVPRNVIGSDSSYIELHIFTDASQTAYGACAYLRTVSNTNSTTTVRLLCSKGKVAPLKPVSIPRLELCGALLGARLYLKIRESLHCQFKSVVFWTDSTIVLGWLRMAPNLLKTFVQNRVVEIHELTKELPWCHVSGKENPADLVSRGYPLPDLASSTLWWEGPSFLHDFGLDCAQLTLDSSPNSMRDDLPEVKLSAVNVLLTKQSVELFPFSRFSQFERMRRSFAYVLRFINNTRIKINRQSGALTLDELRKSELVLVRISQRESFNEEYNMISKNKSLKKTPCLFKLNLFIDTNDIMRVGGRIGYSEQFDYEKKHPILLCSKHRFSVLLMRHEHQRLLHAAPQALLYDIRQRWWPVGGRNLARKIVNECVACKRLKGKTLNPIMGNFPKERLVPTYPFLYCGVDYAGPMLTLNRKGRGAKTVKSYICLFVCFVTRALHLELVSDLSTEAYILALKRFISRRGKPNEIFSDNGKNFVGAKNELTKFITNSSADIIEYAHSQSIKLRFIPPYTAHFGGLWEAGVKSCKLHLSRVIGNAHLTFEELTTVLTQVEAILNSRPLSPLSTDPHDLLPLSPGHFLVGRPLTAPVYQDMRGDPERILNRYQRVEQIRHNFWTRWAKEYVSELQTRCKWRENVDSLEPNTLVIIKDDKLPPLKWSLGRIITTISGPDGISRVADIRTASGIIRRSFSKICPLFREEDVTQQQRD